MPTPFNTTFAESLPAGEMMQPTVTVGPPTKEETKPTTVNYLATFICIVLLCFGYFMFKKWEFNFFKRNPNYAAAAATFETF